MANIFFLETKNDIDVLRKYLASDDIIIALSSLSAYALEKKGLHYRLLEGEYYSHVELYRALAGYNDRITDIMKYIDEMIFKIDYRFRELQLGPFYYSLFDTEVPILNIISRIFEIKSVFDKERPSKVKIINQGDLFLEGVRFTEKGSLINEVVKLLKDYYDYELIIYESGGICSKKHYPIVTKDKFWRPKSLFIKKLKLSTLYLQKLKKKIIYCSFFLISKLFIRKKCNKILNVDCWGLGWAENELMKRGWIIYKFPSLDFEHNKIKKEFRFKDQFEKAFKIDGRLKQLFEFSGILYFEIISKSFLMFSDCFESMLNDYSWLNSYVKNSKIDIAFFQTHAGWCSKNKLLPIILKKNKIPYVCWMHGGYGANKSVSGYESSDYLLGDKYFVYGKKIKALIDKYYSHYNLTTYVTGSPYLENLYKYYQKPKNKKKVITYILSPFGYPLNQVYSTECIRYKRFGYWVPTRAIVDSLLKYQNDYSIVLRPHADKISGEIQRDLLTEYLHDRKANNICIISAEELSLTDILFRTDLVISNGLSTSFFEASLTSADIFLLDDSDLTEDAEHIIDKRTFHFRNIQDFCKRLERYLEDGNFYTRNSSAFIKEFLDVDNKKTRATKISTILDSILLRRQI